MYIPNLEHKTMYVKIYLRIFPIKFDLIVICHYYYQFMRLRTQNTCCHIFFS